ncbi:hypothetical protein [Mesorhizobium sp. M7A.F.Ca.CA.002.12.1.1]|uniref:hypothetical protein n=1 Tax=Mesorhizobium sp. M7A.F.Ca.CA.002.12.1.1 TaxID=2496735 RepID=UPI000FC9F6D4|nr:hypothetical protein [Mesorhizobium sp. M7A.F.Ca.CA.002.12.1.1]RUX60190.1 hypothetical protein EN989_11290 [Mesorhizobium sp. M7A.F.Ca.CA.002.12.1.1]
MWIRLDDEELDLLRKSLNRTEVYGTTDETDAAITLQLKISKQIADAEDDRDSGYIEQARELYAHGSDDDIEIDDDATFSRSDDGIWVQMWGWIRFPEPEDEEEDDGE